MQISNGTFNEIFYHKKNIDEENPKTFFFDILIYGKIM